MKEKETMAEKNKKLVLNIKGVRKIALSSYIAEKLGDQPRYLYNLLVKLQNVVDRILEEEEERNKKIFAENLEK